MTAPSPDPGRASSRPTIALVDNTCNNAYVTAKLLRRHGYDAHLVEEPGMPFNQQPVWEDADIVEPASEVAMRPRDAAYWRRKEVEVGWTKPEWVHRPDLRPLEELRQAPAIARGVAAAVPPWLLPFGLAAALPTSPVVRTLVRFDVLLPLGSAATSAYLSGRPYSVITMGWDINTLPFMTDAPSPIHRARGWLQRKALARATHILGMPAVDRPHLDRIGLGDLLLPFPDPCDVDGYAEIPGATRAEIFGPAIAQQMEGKVVYLCASRIHYRLKGTDLLLRAFAEVLRADERAFLVLLGWGSDLERATALAAELRLDQNFLLLPLVMSKRRLVRTFRAVDVALDQFVVPAYGTLAREALACGLPLVSSYDPDAPQPHPPDDPAPVLPARTVPAIRDAILRLLDPALRARLGAEGIAWARRNHQEAPIRALATILAEIEERGEGAA